jgi:hypothetical protein
MAMVLSSWSLRGLALRARARFIPRARAAKEPSERRGPSTLAQVLKFDGGNLLGIQGAECSDAMNVFRISRVREFETFGRMSEDRSFGDQFRQALPQPFTVKLACYV